MFNSYHGDWLICSLDTSAFSALEVLTTTALYKFTYVTYLLTDRDRHTHLKNTASSLTWVVRSQTHIVYAIVSSYPIPQFSVANFSMQNISHSSSISHIRIIPAAPWQFQMYVLGSGWCLWTMHFHITLHTATWWLFWWMTTAAATELAKFKEILLSGWVK